MTTIAVVPTGYANNASDWLKVKADRSGAVRNERGTVTVPSGTAANAYIGLRPFLAGAVFSVHDKSFHCGNFGASSTTVNFGVVYADSTTDDPDAFASLSTAAQSGGFVTIDETSGMTLKAPANGWVVCQIIAADADANADITFNYNVAYDE